MFKFQTNSVAAICGLMFGFRELVDTVRLQIEPEGISIGEAACQDKLYLYASFAKERFMQYEVRKPVTICFQPKIIYYVLNTSSKTWELMEWEYDEKKSKNTLFIKRSGGTIEESFEIPLLLDESEIYVAPKRLVNYLLLLNSGMFVNIISSLNSISTEFVDNWLTIQCTPTSVKFGMDHGFMIGHAYITLLTDIPNDDDNTTRRSKRTGEPVVDTDLEIDDEDSTITHQYKLGYLYQMVKCFSLTNGSILMYISKDYPITFEIKVGTLGVLKASLMFREDGDDDDEMQE